MNNDRLTDDMRELASEDKTLTVTHTTGTTPSVYSNHGNRATPQRFLRFAAAAAFRLGMTQRNDLPAHVAASPFLLRLLDDYGQHEHPLDVEHADGTRKTLEIRRVDDAARAAALLLERVEVEEAHGHSGEAEELNLEPKPIALQRAVEQYHVSKSTLRDKVRKHGWKDLREPDKQKTQSPLILDENEIAQVYTKKTYTDLSEVRRKCAEVYQK
jgi:hypothetical protein